MIDDIVRVAPFNEYRKYIKGWKDSDLEEWIAKYSGEFIVVGEINGYTQMTPINKSHPLLMLPTKLVTKTSEEIIL